jgi:hypothetical protein
VYHVPAAGTRLGFDNAFSLRYNEEELITG